MQYTNLPEAIQNLIMERAGKSKQIGPYQQILILNKNTRYRQKKRNVNRLVEDPRERLSTNPHFFRYVTKFSRNARSVPLPNRKVRSRTLPGGKKLLHIDYVSRYKPKEKKTPGLQTISLNTNLSRRPLSLSLNNNHRPKRLNTRQNTKPWWQYHYIP